MATYLSDTTELVKLGKSSAQVQQAQNAAAEDIDAAFRAAGYATPLDTSAITDADIKARFEAKLAVTEETIAFHYLVASDVTKDGEGDFHRKEFDRAMRYLASIRAGTTQAPGDLARRSKTFAVAGDREDSLTQTILDVAGSPFAS